MSEASRPFSSSLASRMVAKDRGEPTMAEQTSKKTRPEVLDFLLRRRSHPARLLSEPPPDPADLEKILTAGVRVPDHGKLEPWRLIVLSKPARERIARLMAERGRALDLPQEKIEKDIAAFASPLIVTVVSSPKPNERIPLWEQHLSAGAVCLSLLNAALALGYGACWLTGFAAYDDAVRREGLGLDPNEAVAGFIHIGRSAVAPPERPRPELGRIVRWLEA